MRVASISLTIAAIGTLRRFIHQPAFGAVVLGALAFAIGAFVGYRTVSFYNRSVPVESRVVDDTIGYDDRNKLRHYPVVEYADDAGTTHRKRLDVGSSSSWENGRTFTIRYDPKEPDAPRLSGALDWLFPIVFLVPGTLFVIAGIRELATH